MNKLYYKYFLLMSTITVLLLLLAMVFACVPGCTTYMDIVIVLDGSNSIYPWSEVQNFLKNILSKFHISPEQMQVCGVMVFFNHII